MEGFSDGSSTLPASTMKRETNGIAERKNSVIPFFFARGRGMEREEGGRSTAAGKRVRRGFPVRGAGIRFSGKTEKNRSLYERYYGRNA